MKWLRLTRCYWDRMTAVLLILGGLVAVTAAALRARGTANVADQLTYLTSGGIVGLAVMAIGLTCWLSADLHDDWREMRSLEEAVQHVPDREGLPSSAPGGPGGQVRAPAELS